MGKLEARIEKIICESVKELDRPDLYRGPLVAFSSATDKRYDDLKEIIGSWHMNPTELLPEAKTVISYFVPFTTEVVNAPKRSKGETPIWGESYAVINSYFEKINQRICDFLESEGYLTRTIPATHTYDEKDMKSMWSHRSAAAIAGLGSFGANRMLITKKGSGGRYCAVLTSAELKASDKTPENPCLYMKEGSCELCFKICPVDALKPDSIDRFACQKELNKNKKLLEESIGLFNADTCGKCISICPVSYIE